MEPVSARKSRYWLYEEFTELHNALSGSLTESAYEFIDVMYVYTRSSNAVANLVEHHMHFLLVEIIGAGLSINDLIIIGTRKWTSAYEDRKKIRLTSGEQQKWARVNLRKFAFIIEHATHALRRTQSKMFDGAICMGSSRIEPFSDATLVEISAKRKRDMFKEVEND